MDKRDHEIWNDHLEGSPGSHRTTTREVKAIDQDAKLNRAQWDLAERMAELKSVWARYR
jgi:hypothetical protein